MGKRILTVVIEKGKSGFWCYAKEIDGIVGTGKTVAKAKKDQIEALKSMIEYWIETDNDISKIEDYEFVYEFDLSHLSGVERVKRRQKRQIEKGNTVEVDLKNNGTESLIMAVEGILTQHLGCFPNHWKLDICRELMQRPLEERLEIAGAWICQTLDILKLVEEEKKNPQSEIIEDLAWKQMSQGKRSQEENTDGRV